MGDAGVVQHLLDQNAEPTPTRAGPRRATRPLMAASRKGHVDVARLLLGRGADVSVGKAPRGATALIIASQDGHVEVARMLLAHNSRPRHALRLTDWGDGRFHSAVSRASHKWPRGGGTAAP